MNRRITAVVTGFGLALVMLAGPAKAQIAKSGSFEGTFPWSSYGETTESANGSSYWHGGFNGGFVNSAGSGFLHEAGITCPAAGANVGGRQFFQGSCTVTDADGDQAMLIWNCEMRADGVCPGPQMWVAGTGKYEGISGEMTFEGRFIGNTPQGISHWKGEWKLP